jgi:hypothetical protein
MTALRSLTPVQWHGDDPIDALSGHGHDLAEPCWAIKWGRTSRCRRVVIQAIGLELGDGWPWPSIQAMMF